MFRNELFRVNYMNDDRNYVGEYSLNYVSKEKDRMFALAMDVSDFTLLAFIFRSRIRSARVRERERESSEFKPM